MIALLRQALARLPDGDSPLRARVTARLAAALTPPTERRGHRRDPGAGRRAPLAMARRLGDRHTLLYVLQFVAATVGFDAPETERFALMQETVELARPLDQRLVLLNALPAYITALLARGDRADAEAELAELRRAAGRASRSRCTGGAPAAARPAAPGARRLRRGRPAERRGARAGRARERSRPA